MPPKKQDRMLLPKPESIETEEVLITIKKTDLTRFNHYLKTYEEREGEQVTLSHFLVYAGNSLLARDVMYREACAPVKPQQPVDEKPNRGCSKAKGKTKIGDQANLLVASGDATHLLPPPVTPEPDAPIDSASQAS